MLAIEQFEKDQVWILTNGPKRVAKILEAKQTMITKPGGPGQPSRRKARARSGEHFEEHGPRWPLRRVVKRPPGYADTEVTDRLVARLAASGAWARIARPSPPESLAA